MKDAYQIWPFPMPCVWLIFMAPALVSNAATFLFLFLNMVVTPLVLLPWRRLRMVAAMAQILIVGWVAALSNHGCVPLCFLALAFSVLDDGWHGLLWSSRILVAWGCPPNSDQCAEEAKDNVPPLLGMAFVSCCIAALSSGLAFGGGQVLTGCVIVGAIACGVLITALVLAEGCRQAHHLSSPIALLLFCAGLLQLCGDMGDMMPMPSPMLDVLSAFELTHVAHALGEGSGEVQMVCPVPEGRFDVAITALMYENEHKAVSQEMIVDVGPMARTTGLASSHHHQHVFARPVWQAFQSPRLERLLWEEAQKLQKLSVDIVVPSWMARLFWAVMAQKGPGAKLSAGPWDLDSLEVKYLGAKRTAYMEIVPPLRQLQLSVKQSVLSNDVHGYNWWAKTRAEALGRVIWENVKDTKVLCQTLPWADVPFVEGFATLLSSALIWIIVVQGAN